jgi:hypothetical protein
MPRIIVIADPSPRPGGVPLHLLDEQVHSVHLSSSHAAAQLVERLAWAISDAEDAEDARAERPVRQLRRSPRRVPSSDHRARVSVSA